MQVQTFLLSLVRDPLFPDVANDIVIEAASVRYQDAIDRFVRGDDVEIATLRRAWEDHTVPNSLGVQAEELIRAVRAVNASLAEPKRLRVIAGDPPIDWDTIASRRTLNRSIDLAERTESWRVPSLAFLRGTTLGASDFAVHYRGPGDGSRFGVKAGQLVSIPREEWRVMRMQDPFDAVLYLGPPASMTTSSVPAALCRDVDFVKRRIDRLTLFAPPVEIQNFRKACGL